MGKTIVRQEKIYNSCDNVTLHEEDVYGPHVAGFVVAKVPSGSKPAGNHLIN
jgi:hypothetical protein